MATKQAHKRLTKEYKSMVETPTPFITAHPSETNILEWHYLITGPPNTPYENGQYHGTLTFTHDYPFKPPAIRMITPNGRFQTNTRLCLSMSDYHPDLWNPAWSVSTILNGLLSFMTGTEPTTGSITTTDQTKRKFAAESLHWNATKSTVFKAQFPELVSENLSRYQQLKQEASAAAQAPKPVVKAQEKINLDELNPEDRIRYLAAHPEAAGAAGTSSAGAASSSNPAVWIVLLLAIFFGVVKLIY